MPSQLKAALAPVAAPVGYDYKLVSRRTKTRFNSTGGHLTALKAKRTTNPAHIHPDDMAKIGLSEGQLVRITSLVGSIIGVAEASPGIRQGIISMAHAYGDVGSGPDSVRDQGVSTNRLVSETASYDPITGQSLQSAIPIKVSAVA